MGTNDHPGQPSVSVFGAVLEAQRDLTRAVSYEILPRIPWRAAVVWGVALGATFVIPGIYDLLNPTSSYGLSSDWASLLGLAICFCAGLQAAWRGRDFARGGVVTLVAILIGFVVAMVGDVTAVLVVSKFQSLNLTRALEGALDVPLPVMLLLGGPIGYAGAAIAVGLSRCHRRTVVQS